MPNDATAPKFKVPAIDMDYVQRVLLRLLETPSPTGFTDSVVNVACEELTALGIEHELTRRGAIRANLPGEQYVPDKAIVAHLDTLGAVVKNLKSNGRLEVAQTGTWSPRFAEGARVTIFSDFGMTTRGTVLPSKASGHVYNEEVDSQPSTWENLEIRIDRRCRTEADLRAAGFNVGDVVAIDTRHEITDTGFINSRHLDDKAGVAAMLGAAKAIKESGAELPVDCHLLLTISEEVGVGASHVLHGDVSEMVSIDNGTIAPGQNTCEYGVTICMQDASGPYDWHLTHALLQLCRDYGVEHSRDVFKYYHSDAAAALEAGNDIRTALVCFALDASHGYERTHIDSLKSLATLLVLYMQNQPAVPRDRMQLGPPEGFPGQSDPPEE
jgi:peptidase M42 family hydrolase